MQDTISHITSLLRSIGGGAADPKKHHVTAIILAAGIGSRMNAPNGTTKQMMELCGMPLIAHTVAVFEQSDAIREIVLVGRAEELPIYEEMKQRYDWKKLRAAVPGGDTRQDSALEGFKAIGDDTELVLFHDGARCLVTPDILEQVAREGLLHGAAIAAEAVSSTVKQSDGKGFVAQTLDRSAIFLAQTPQAFRTEVYRAAAYLHIQKGRTAVTDDAMLAEQEGLPVKLVLCTGENLKVTTPHDLRIARVMMEERQEIRAEEEAQSRQSAEDRTAGRKKRKEARQP